MTFCCIGVYLYYIKQQNMKQTTQKEIELKEWQEVLVFENDTEYEYGIILPKYFGDQVVRPNQYRVFIYTSKKPKEKWVYGYQVCERG